MDAYVAIFVAVTSTTSVWFVSGNAYGRPVEESPAVHVPDFYCMAVMERDTCVPIVQEAFNDSDTGLRDAFTHYCRVIPAFVPCVEENRDSFLELLNCSGSIMEMEIERMWGGLLTMEEQLDLMIDLFNVFNPILCNRIDEAANLIECIKSKDRQFQPLMRRCVANHVMPLMSRGMSPGRSFLCAVMYGYMSCMKDGIVGLCGVNYFDLLETTYEEVIVDVIGDTFDCNEEHEPLLAFVRSLQEKFRR